METIERFTRTITFNTINEHLTCDIKERRLIGYKTNKKRFVETLTDTEKEELDIELLNW